MTSYTAPAESRPVISEITGLDSAAAVWLVIVSDLSYISSDHYTLLELHSKTACAVKLIA